MTFVGQRIAPLAIALLASLPFVPRAAGAQGTPVDPAAPRVARLRPLFRADVLFARNTAAHVGAGLAITAGNYVRLSLEGAAGIARGGVERQSVASGRVDLVGRFLLDPYAQHARGPYAGGGISVRRDGADGWRPALLVLVGIEGRPRAGWAPSLEAGLGRGARVGLVLRASRRDRRP